MSGKDDGLSIGGPSSLLLVVWYLGKNVSPESNQATVAVSAPSVVVAAEEPGKAPETTEAPRARKVTAT